MSEPLCTREEFYAFLEGRMTQIREEIKALIEQHDIYGHESIQKSYLWKAFHHMKDGIDWFDWTRKRHSKSPPQRGDV